MPALTATDHAALDRPIWSALTTAHAHFAAGAGLARRYPVDIAPFAATADESEAAFKALRALIPDRGSVALFTPQPIAVPAALELERAALLYQMVATEPRSAPDEAPGIVELGAGDAAEMLALTDLTKPGPFAAGTYLMGRYIGIRQGGQLVAMAGERMALGAQVEISAVCVHPAQRGHGHAQRLMQILMAALARRDATPFLHVYSDNASAIALYRRLGFEIRQHLHLSVLRHRSAA